MKTLSKKKPLPQPSEPATLGPIAAYHERKLAEEAASYKRRNGASGILRAVKEGGEIRLNTLKELLELLETKTAYRFYIAVEILPTGSALLKTIDNERDALETIRRLKAKP